MLALELEKTVVKAFMSKLLREELFDLFEARTLEITAAVKIIIDGANVPQDDQPITEEHSQPKRNGFVLWNKLRPLVLEIIKLSAKPKHVKIVFAFPNPTEIHTNAAALFLNLSYENDGVTFTTATSQKEFALDKTLDAVWDEWIRNFFAQLPMRDRE